MIFGIFGRVLLGGAGLVLTFASMAFAQDIPNVLVMVEDGDRTSIARDSRIQRNALAAISDRMNLRGYRVFDETALQIDGHRQSGETNRVRRSDAELLITARTISQPPIDIALIYEGFMSIDAKSFATFADLRLAARALDPSSGRLMGSFELRSPASYRLPVDCGRKCILETLAEEGRALGWELSDIMADRLDQFFTASGEGTAGAGSADAGFERIYTLRFNECSAGVRSDFEPYLVVFSGYKDHRANTCSSTRCELTYVSSIAPGKLLRNLERMTVETDHPARVTASGREYQLTCAPRRKTDPRQLDPKDW